MVFPLAFGILRGRHQHTHSPALALRRGIGEYPPLLHPPGRAPPLPQGEAVNRIPPLRDNGLNGIFQADRLTCRTEKRSESEALAGRVNPVGRSHNQDNLDQRSEGCHRTQ